MQTYDCARWKVSKNGREYWKNALSVFECYAFERLPFARTTCEWDGPPARRVVVSGTWPVCGRHFARHGCPRRLRPVMRTKPPLSHAASLSTLSPSNVSVPFAWRAHTSMSQRNKLSGRALSMIVCVRRCGV